MSKRRDRHGQMQRQHKDQYYRIDWSDGIHGKAHAQPRCNKGPRHIAESCEGDDHTQCQRRVNQDIVFSKPMRAAIAIGGQSDRRQRP